MTAKSPLFLELQMESMSPSGLDGNCIQVTQQTKHHKYKIKAPKNSHVTIFFWQSLSDLLLTMMLYF